MDFIIKDRQGGKTTTLVEWVLSAPEGVHRVIVCVNASMVDATAHRLYARMSDMGGEVRRADVLKHVVHYEGLRKGIYDQLLRGLNVELGIDDIDVILNKDMHSRFSIDIVAATGKVVPL